MALDRLQKLGQTGGKTWSFDGDENPTDQYTKSAEDLVTFASVKNVVSADLQSSVDLLLPQTKNVVNRFHNSLFSSITPNEIQAVQKELDANYSNYSKNEIIVRYTAQAQEQTKLCENQLSALGFSVIKNLTNGSLGDGDIVVFNVPEGVSIAEAIAGMRRINKDILYAAPNEIIQLDPEQLKEQADRTPQPGGLTGFSAKNDPRFSEQYGLYNTGDKGGKEDADIDAPEAWDLLTNNPDEVLVAVIDTGIDYTHEDLANMMWKNLPEALDHRGVDKMTNGVDDNDDGKVDNFADYNDGKDNDGNGYVDDALGWNAVYNSNNPFDDNKHGTHCAGIINGEGNNNKGIVGVTGGDGKVKLIAVKILDSFGSGRSTDIVEGIVYVNNLAKKLGKKIITNNSWGGNFLNPAIRDAFLSTNDHLLNICAAGNSGRDNDETPNFPSNYPYDNMVAVASSNHKDVRSSFSNYGQREVDIAAPGEGILSATPNNRYQFLSGTSMATPFVTGVAAMIAHKFPTLSLLDVKQQLLGSTDSLLEWYGQVGYGRLNAANALQDDDLAPAAPEKLQAYCLQDRTYLKFVAPGDDGKAGKVAKYDIRISDKPIIDGETNGNEINYSVLKSGVLPAKQPAGQVEMLSLPYPLDLEKTWYVAVQAYDERGNKSPIVTTQADKPKNTDIAFHDDLTNPSSNWWSSKKYFRDEFGLEYVPTYGNVWSDSPYGNYDENADKTLTLKKLDLRDFTDISLFYDMKHDIGPEDALYIEVTTTPWWPDWWPAEKNQKHWKICQTITGQDDWHQVALDLSEFKGKEIYVRFRLATKGKKNQISEHNGFMLDNISVLGKNDKKPKQPAPTPRPVTPGQS